MTTIALANYIRYLLATECKIFVYFHPLIMAVYFHIGYTDIAINLPFTPL